MDQVVCGHRYRLNDDYRDAEAHGCLHVLRDGQKRAHSEKERERQVFNEHRLHKQAQIMFNPVSHK